MSGGGDGSWALAVPERPQWEGRASDEYRRPPSSIVRAFRSLPLVSRLVSRRRSVMCRDEAEAEPGAPFEEELRELRLNVPQDVRASCASDAETAAASTPLVERSSSSTSRRQPGVRYTGITRTNRFARTAQTL